MNPANHPFGRPWLILCEGESDRRFLWKLIEERNIHAGQFDVLFACRSYDSTGGRGNFGAWLNDAYLSQSFRQNVKAVLIVSEHDDDSAQSLKALHDGLAVATEFTVPLTERTIGKGKNGYPDLVFLMIPMDKQTGNLETLCIEAAFGKQPGLRKPLTDYLNSTPAAGWRHGKQTKMQVQCFLAATCEAWPDTNLGNHWKLPNADHHIPVTSNCFDPIADFLNGFGNLLAN